MASGAVHTSILSLRAAKGISESSAMAIAELTRTALRILSGDASHQRVGEIIRSTFLAGSTSAHSMYESNICTDIKLRGNLDMYLSQRNKTLNQFVLTS